MSRTITKVLNPEKTKFEYQHLFHYPYRMIDAFKVKENPPNLSIFEQRVRSIMNNITIWDFGGSAGIDFFRFRPINCNWIIWEVPEATKFFRENIHEKNLSWNESRLNLDINDNKDVILFSRQAIQYLPSPLKFIKDNLDKVKSLCLMDLLIGKETALVEQVGVGPCWIIGLDDLKVLLTEFDIEIETRKTEFWEVNTTGVETLPAINLLAIRK